MIQLVLAVWHHRLQILLQQVNKLRQILYLVSTIFSGTPLAIKNTIHTELRGFNYSLKMTQNSDKHLTVVRYV